MKSQTIKTFRIIGIAEGISYLLLLGVAMPLKYMAGLPLAVKYTGWAHGVLFVLYLLYLVKVEVEFKWKFSTFVMAGLASLVPFGPFIMEKKLKSEQLKAEAAELAMQKS
jgi:integral membrane protein